MSLISVDEAVAHLRITDEGDPDLALKMASAEGIILDYLKVVETSPPVWDATTVPALVKAAILLQLAELWQFRGDEPEGQGPNRTDGDLSPTITNLLRRYRSPAYA